MSIGGIDTRDVGRIYHNVEDMKEDYSNFIFSFPKLQTSFLEKIMGYERI